MMVVLIIVLVLVVGALAAVVTGRIGADSMARPTETSAFAIPDGRLGAHGADAVRFDQSLRGYNMAQVDAVLDRLFDEIAELERRVGGHSATAAGPLTSTQLEAHEGRYVTDERADTVVGSETSYGRETRDDAHDDRA